MENYFKVSSSIDYMLLNKHAYTAWEMKTQTVFVTILMMDVEKRIAHGW